MIMRKKTTSLIPVRLGALLVAANLLRPEAMANALMIARQTGRKIGEVLVSHGYVTPDDLTSALELQHLIKQGSITVEMGTRALQQAHQHHTPLRTALNGLGWTDDNSVKTHDLASLLLTAECMRPEQLQQARWNSATNHLPLGRNLVLSGAISPSLLGSALNALVLLRDNKIGFDAAVYGLKQCRQKRISLEEALEFKFVPSANHVRIGELLSSAGLLSESDAMIAVENGLLNQRSIGEVLLRSNMVSPLVLDATIKLQKMIEENSVQRTQASELLRQVASKQVKLEDFLNEMSQVKTRALELLVSSKLVTNDDIAISLEACPQQENDILRALFMSGAITQDMFRATVRCVYAISEKELTEAGAIKWLRDLFASAVVKTGEQFAHEADGDDVILQSA